VQNSVFQERDLSLPQLYSGHLSSAAQVTSHQLRSPQVRFSKQGRAAATHTARTVKARIKHPSFQSPPRAPAHAPAHTHLPTRTDEQADSRQPSKPTADNRASRQPTTEQADSQWPMKKKIIRPSSLREPVESTTYIRRRCLTGLSKNFEHHAQPKNNFTYTPTCSPEHHDCHR
jgi:hypothetical protein